MLNRSQQLFACVGVYLVASLLWFALGDALVDRLGLYDSSSAGRRRFEEYAFVLVSAAMFGVIAWRRAVLDRRSDMTVRRHLEESEARLRSLVQNSSDIISVVDEQGEVIFQTDAVSRLLGWNTADEDAGWYRVHEEDMPNLRTALAQARTRPGAEASFVYRCLHADGSWRWLESTAVNRQEDPAIGGVVIHTRDVTASRLAEERLRAETEFTNQIIDSLPGLFYAVEPSGKVVRANRAFATTLGYEVDGLDYKHPYDLFVEEDREKVAAAAARVFQQGSASIEASFRTAAGRTVPYSLTGMLIETSTGPLIVGTGLDISEQIASRQRIEELNRELHHRLGHITALREIDNAIVGSLDRSGLLDRILHQIGDRLRVDAASVLLYDEKVGRLRTGASIGLAQVTRENTDLALGEDLAGRAGLERRTVVATGRDRVANELSPARGLAQEGFEAYIATPLVAKGQLLGVLEVFSREEMERSDDWRDVLAALATQSALALENTNLVESLQRSNSEILAAYERTIEGWSRALDLRDEETEGHSRRVTEQTVRLAERLGIPDEDLVHIRRGALLHDIGKMGVPDHVLRKPGPLTDAEWELMKQHPDFAYELLLPIEFLRPALDIPYAHHERWNGTGYPRGLEGEAIPLSARIFAVVDVYDALTSDRPYRPAWERSRALAYLRDNTGILFDPAVVDEFLSMLCEESVSERPEVLRGLAQSRRNSLSRGSWSR